MAEAVIRHARETPDRRWASPLFRLPNAKPYRMNWSSSEGQNPDTEDSSAAASTEPFFVKNLENIQGDERDVIFISLGYGRTKEGYVAMSFGPLNSDGGERRLNVLISRAKLRCEVFASITGDDIDLSRSKGRASRHSRCSSPSRRPED